MMDRIYLHTTIMYYPFLCMKHWGWSPRKNRFSFYPKKKKNKKNLSNAGCCCPTPSISPFSFLSSLSDSMMMILIPVFFPLIYKNIYPCIFTDWVLCCGNSLSAQTDSHRDFLHPFLFFFLLKKIKYLKVSSFKRA